MSKSKGPRPETSRQKWKVLEDKVLFETSYFKLRVERCQLPDRRVMPKYYVFDFLDWVNIVPVTPEGNIVALKQYRQAAKDTFLEIPGGSIDPFSQELPQMAAERELLEETGFKGAEVIDLGAQYPNPALQSNRVHTFLAMGCKKVSELCLDPYEDIEVVELSVKEMQRRLCAGEVSHSIMMASLTLALAHLGEI